MKYIDVIENKAQVLHGFLEVNRNEEEGDAWIFGLNPPIVEFLNKLNKTECDLVKQQMWNWGDTNLSNLADPILEVKNSHLDSAFIYGKIFLKIQDLESLEYLVENIQVINDNVKTRPFKFYSDLIYKIEWTANQLGKNYSIYKNHIERKLKKEIESHNIIDINSGNIDLNDNLKVTSKTSFEEITIQLTSYQIAKEFVNHNNGYEWIYLKNVEILPVSYHFGFCFYKDKLKYVDFGLSDINEIKKQNWNDWSEENELSKKEFYDDYLNILIGRKRKFQWGKIETIYDPRGGTTSILLKYK